jgi:hypothetical protein
MVYDAAMPRLGPTGWRRSSPRCLAGLVVVALWGARSSPALCGENEKTIARAHYETATRLCDLREYSKALDEYKAAYLARPDPAFLFNIGQCFRKLGNTASALDFYQQYLKKTPDEDPNRAQAEARIHDIEIERASDDDPFARPDEMATRLPEPKAAPAPLHELPSPPQEVSASALVPLPAVPAVLPPPAAIRPARLDLTASQPRDEDVSPPIYRTWWFWTGVGAVVVAGTVTAILLAKGGNEPNTASTTLGTQRAFQ